MIIMKTLRNKKNQKGFGLIELLIVLLIIAIVVVLALPQIISSRRLFRFSGMQRQVTTALREARQEAMSQRKPITFRYDNNDKNIIIWGGSLGNAGAAENRLVPVAGDGLAPDDLVYGRPPGATSSALGDGSNVSPLSDNKLEIIFQSDGSVVDANDNPQNKALFFYSPKAPEESAFAVSVLGAGGRVKIWQYNSRINSYVE